MTGGGLTASIGKSSVLLLDLKPLYQMFKATADDR